MSAENSPRFRPSMSLKPPPNSSRPQTPSRFAPVPPSFRSQTSWLDRIPVLSDDPAHPAQIGLRTYALALSLSLGPALVPFITALVVPRSKTASNASWTALRRVLRRELGPDGFAFSVTLSVAGGAALSNYLACLVAQLKGREGEQDIINTHEKPGEYLHASTKPGNDSTLSTLSTLHALVEIVTERLKAGLVAMSPRQQTFWSYFLTSIIGVLLLQSGRERTVRLRALRKAPTTNAAGIVDLTSPTLDLSLLLLVRAVDSVVQAFILRRPVPSDRPDAQTVANEHGQRMLEPRVIHDRLERERIKRQNAMRQMWTSRVDALVFWACSARIMWCYFYEPQRLPSSYVKWIHNLANLDGRILDVLRHIRDGKWSYIRGSPSHADTLHQTARGLGLSSILGDPNAVPAYGGKAATATWRSLNVTDRDGLGGVPCELLHGQVGSSLGLQSSCTTNAALRILTGLEKALAIYLPVHFLPVLLTKPQILLRPHRFMQTLFGALRSASFLSSFIGIYWYTVCLSRTLILARLFPFISHDFWDGPYGGVFVGSVACGGSIWVENGRRRGEMALYVLPRAIRACLPHKLVSSGSKGLKVAERLAFALSLATLLTASKHRPDSLRGLSRWTLAFITNGPNAGFWKQQRRDPSIPPTPSFPATPAPVNHQELKGPH